MQVKRKLAAAAVICVVWVLFWSSSNFVCADGLATEPLSALPNYSFFFVIVMTMFFLVLILVGAVWVRRDAIKKHKKAIGVTALSILVAGSAAALVWFVEPLNIMCSSRWAMPVSP